MTDTIARVEAGREESTMKVAAKDCDVCHGKGWAFVDIEEVVDAPRVREVQRCDACDVFATDDEAREASMGLFDIVRLYEKAGLATQQDAADYWEVDVRRVRTWERNGVGWEVADRLACSVHLHPSSVWGESWWSTAPVEAPDTIVDRLADSKQLTLDGGKKPSFWETRARAAKAQAIVEWLRAAGKDASTAAEMSVERRNEVAKFAGQRTPSDTTWALVVDLLGSTEAVTA